jgi:RepB DNA-primase from phage plasmid
MARDDALDFLGKAFRLDDWIAVMVKSTATDRVSQRVAPVSVLTSTSVQAWLDREDRTGSSVYVSVNALSARRVSRRRSNVTAIRHVFLDVDHDSAAVLSAIASRSDLPMPSYVVHTSPGRTHVMWRVTGFGAELNERTQKHLARELGGDTAATSCAHMTRLPGFLNHKYSPPYRVRFEVGDPDRVYEPPDFPTAPPSAPLANGVRRGSDHDALDRARRYVAAVPPAIAGQHGDAHTFRVCCRLVRGFALADSEALSIMRAWNARCEPPWSERELLDKLKHARRYGLEPIGALLEASS